MIGYLTQVIRAIAFVFIALLLSVYCMITGRKVPRKKLSFRRMGQALLDGAWSLFLPAFILGGIATGMFDAVEAAAISVVLAIVDEFYVNDVGSVAVARIDLDVSDGSVDGLPAIAAVLRAGGRHREEREQGGTQAWCHGDLRATWSVHHTVTSTARPPVPAQKRRRGGAP